MTIPGILYSLLVAIGAWAIDYFSTGAGAGVPWAPILIAAIPVLLKLFTAGLSSEAPGAASRGMEHAAPRSYASKVLWG